MKRFTGQNNQSETSLKEDWGVNVGKLALFDEKAVTDVYFLLSW